MVAFLTKNTRMYRIFVLLSNTFELLVELAMARFPEDLLTIPRTPFNASCL